MERAGRTGSSVRAERPWGVLFPIGVLCLVANHWAVVGGSGISAEGLVLGCWLVPVGGWGLLAGRSLDAVWEWVNRSSARTAAFVALNFAAALGAAEAVAWFVYGQHLFG